MQIAERNRQIKKTLEKSFGRGNIRVRGSRGTAYGWVSVHINYAPRTPDHRSQIVALIRKMFARDGIEIGTYGYDDPGSDYGFGKKIHLGFERCQYQSEHELRMAETNAPVMVKVLHDGTLAI